MGNRLAAVLRAFRHVISNSQDLINAASATDKGLTGEVMQTKVIEASLAAKGEPPLRDDLTEREGHLTQTQLTAMSAVIDENQRIINADGLEFKGFIPAVFARLVSKKFGAEMANMAAVKVTAPKNLVRNRMSRPDAWENQGIEEKFRSGD